MYYFKNIAHDKNCKEPWFMKGSGPNGVITYINNNKQKSCKRLNYMGVVQSR